MPQELANPTTNPSSARGIARVSTLVLVAMVLHSFAAVCEAVQIAPLTGERLTVRYLSAAMVRGVEFVARRTTEKPGADAAVGARAVCIAWPTDAGDVVRALRWESQADHHLTRFVLSLPPPARR